MEKPILFNTEMVKAILDGRKTCTRRIVKPQPGSVQGSKCYKENSFTEFKEIKAPYQIEDIIYVRETWTTIDNFKNYADVEIDKNIKYLYKCDDNGKEHVFIDVGVKRWKPSIHMPKKAARIFLRVTNVRVERLQALDYEGAIKEGIKTGYDGWISDFKNLWNSTLKKEQLNMYGWEANPWVWVIEFEDCRM